MGDAEFTEWMGKVDELCMERHSCSVHDLADMTWRAYFDDELTPAQGLDTAEEDGLLT